MRKYTDQQYIKLVENIDDNILQSMMKKEIEMIENIKDSKKKTFVDLGAGHGRLTPILGKISKNVLSIEINPNMLPELKRRSSKFNNAKVIQGDITKLSQILKNEKVKNPVLLLVQNSFGTIEGSSKAVLKEIKKVFKKDGGEIVISFFKAESLKNWGLKLYPKASEMVGEPDLNKLDLEKGIFVSKTGYTSKWRFKAEVKEILNFLGGDLISKSETPNWIILHIKK